ncbi:5-formyltetrahydrofolate cyclo-ligase [Ophiostoma piceae UAMH 11346]|uniref:5-formyltetrahydrofolate cyclo-ligase n=1 Tax=Ophiostoma piceae (strain UAMH 11346) TaxID=1262450 RepID=S3BM78_OPHP1|nr:5-formyltetrahydrofolate cyclo-ligase [Ophiostoma piceae UAMH 11346]
MPDMSLGAVGAGPALAAAKQQLRTQMKQQLKTLPQKSVAAQSAAISSSLSRLQPFVNARRVAVFLSMPAAEVQTDAIVRHALSQGKQVFVPYLHKPGPTLQAETYVPPRVMDMVQLRDVADYESLARDRWGIPSVDAASVEARQRILGDGELESDLGSGSTSLTSSTSSASSLDIILMPGVAFDVDPTTRRVHRCGHGRGFYDYFLHRYALKMASQSQSSSPVRLYGLALTEQVLSVGSVPTGPHDQPLDGLISGDGTVTIPEP